MTDTDRSALVTAVERFARFDRIAVATDFDGTLAPLVDDLTAASAVPAASAAVHDLATRPGVALILVSGRSIPDLRALAKPPPSAVLIGGHGAEIDDPAFGYEPESALTPQEQALLDSIIRALVVIAAEHPGTYVETKPSAAALHSRPAAPEHATAALAAAINGPATWPSVHVKLGHHVVELRLRHNDKGDALDRVLRRLKVDATIYFGDDNTDEDAFALLRPGSENVTVKVGPERSQARFRVNGPEDVAGILRLVADRRSVAAAS
jgi:trehalose-phosphatase